MAGAWVWLLLVVIPLSSGQFLPNGTWVEPPYCANQGRTCPRFTRLDDGTKAYTIQQYVNAKWECKDFTTKWPQTGDEFYDQDPTNPRFAAFLSLRNYAKGDNVDDWNFGYTTRPIRTHMYQDVNARGRYLKTARNFTICLYLDLENEPSPNDPDISITVEPLQTFFVWTYVSYHGDIPAYEANLKLFRAALEMDGADYDQSFHVTAGYGPGQTADQHNELWLAMI